VRRTTGRDRCGFSSYSADVKFRALPPELGTVPVGGRVLARAFTSPGGSPPNVPCSRGIAVAGVAGGIPLRPTSLADVEARVYNPGHKRPVDVSTRSSSRGGGLYCSLRRSLLSHHHSSD
jgi:hypothetical protein